MKKLTPMLLILGTCGSIAVHAMDISGKVSDVNGVALSGATVKLIGNNVSMSTSTDGVFSFKLDGSVGISARRGMTSQDPILENGNLYVSLAEMQNVTVALHDLKGRQTWTNSQQLSAGKHNFQIPMQSDAMVSFVKVTIGNKHFQFKAYNMPGRVVGINSESQARALAKVSAVPGQFETMDSVQVSREGYITRTFPVPDSGRYTVYMNLPDLVLPAAEVERMRAKFQAGLGARYMEKNCKAAVYPEWEGFPLIECTYSMRDASGVVKPARVIMLNGSPIQLARWAVATAQLIKGSTSTSYTNAVYNQIMGASGAQFAVAGNVYEDMTGSGVNKIYCFRNGVTVYPIGMPDYAITRAMTSAEMETSLYGKLGSTTGTYARIQSTTRENYRANGGKIDVGTSSNRSVVWLDVVREQYKASWGNDRNALLLAWAKSGL